jgi:O-antigen/teichoic acid export membrane protein
MELAAGAHGHTAVHLLQRLLGTAFAVLLMAALVIFASIALVIAVAVAIAVIAVLWWRSRSLPRRRTLEGQYRDVSDLEPLEDRRSERL